MLRNISILICDLQTKTIKTLYKPNQIIPNVNLLIESKNI